MAIRYVRSTDAPDTVLMTFRVVHDYRAVLDGDLTDSVQSTGKSPISRWLAWAIEHDEFVSNPDQVGYIARCQIPRGTIALRVMTRVDVQFAHATPGADIDIGDGSDPNGWADSLDWSTAAGVIMSDQDALYNDPTSDPNAGVAGAQYYQTGDTLDVNWNNATAPTAGKAIVFLLCISYHEDLNAEW